jgi:hypothetical protein
MIADHAVNRLIFGQSVPGIVTDGLHRFSTALPTEIVDGNWNLLSFAYGNAGGRRFPYASVPQKAEVCTGTWGAESSGSELPGAKTQDDHCFRMSPHARHLG